MQSIIVEGNKIISIEAGYVEIAGARIVDMRDKFVMAGLFDSHIHMAEGDLNNPLANAADGGKE